MKLRIKDGSNNKTNWKHHKYIQKDNNYELLETCHGGCVAALLENKDNNS